MLADANLCMCVNARVYVLGLNVRYVMLTYVAYVQEESWWQQTDRETERERQTDNYEAQGIVPHLFV